MFWLQARIHGNELHSTEAVLQILRYLGSSGSAEAQQIRDALTVIVIPMYNPDGATANIRQSTTPFRIDLNRDWENFQQPESRAFYALWERLHPRLALDLHHFGQASRVQGTDELNSFQIGARSIDPSRMTALQWLTNRQMAMISVDALRRLGTAGIARYPLIDITNAVLSRMLLGGPGPDGSDPGFMTQGAIFYEVRSVGQKSNGMLEQLFVRPSMAVLNAAADGSLYAHSGSGVSRSASATPTSACERLPSASASTTAAAADVRRLGDVAVGLLADVAPHLDQHRRGAEEAVGVARDARRRRAAVAREVRVPVPVGRACSERRHDLLGAEDDLVELRADAELRRRSPSRSATASSQ